MKNFAYWIFFLMMFPSWLGAQSISIDRVVAREDSLIVEYTLSDTANQARFRVQGYAIVEEDTVEMLRTQGSIGENITPGAQRFVWLVGEQLERFRGVLKVHLVAFPNFTVLLPAEGDLLRPGQPYQVQWYGGNALSDRLVIDLYRYDDRIDSVAIIEKTDRYTWLVPDKIKSGKGYRLRFRGTGATDIDAYGPSFVIKRKTPVWLFIVPAAVVLAGTAAILLLTRDREEALPPPEGPN